MGLQIYNYGSNDEPYWNIPKHSQLLEKDQELFDHAYSVVKQAYGLIDNRTPVKVVYTADAVAVGFIFRMVPRTKHLFPHQKYRYVLASLFELLPLADDLLGVAVM